MSQSAGNRLLRVALIGNPNTGKSTLFNALSGQNVRTGNYPGVTVEKRIGHSSHQGVSIEWTDLPGTYSLVARSPDEWIAVDVLVGRQVSHNPPDVILCVVDASNLERNLFLFTQLLDLGRPIVVALNMRDQAARHGVSIQTQQLAKRLGVTLVETEAHRRLGIDELLTAIVRAADQAAPQTGVTFPDAIETQDARLAELLKSVSQNSAASAASPASGEPVPKAARASVPRFLRLRMLLDEGTESLDHAVGQSEAARILPALLESRAALEQAAIDRSSAEAIARYSWLGDQLQGLVMRADRAASLSFQDRVDRFLVHKFWGTLTFVLIMLLVFQAIFAGAEPLTAGIEAAVGWVSDLVSSLIPAGVLQSLVVDGVIAGVGGVIVFLPQILILFFFIGVLEDCGYMARAAFLMDRLMARIGLNGKAFIPLLSSFACAIPGVLATRTIENRRDRLITMLVAPLMSCSARLPVYFLLSTAFIPPITWLGGWVGLQGLTVAAMYALGILAAVVVALLLRLTILKGETSPFLLELPSFKLPSPRVVVSRMLERGGEFVRRAGTLILAVTILVWGVASFPQDAQAEREHEARIASLEQLGTEQAQAEIEALELTRQSQRLEESALGQAGHWIEPIVRPLGWDWKIGCAVLASFPAREVVVGTLGVLYQLGGDEDEESKPLRDALAQATWRNSEEKVFTIPVALSLMVFFSLCAQCASTLVVIQREAGHWGWALFAFSYMTGLAYLAAFVTYQVGTALLG